MSSCTTAVGCSTARVPSGSGAVPGAAGASGATSSTSSPPATRSSWAASVEPWKVSVTPPLATVRPPAYRGLGTRSIEASCCQAPSPDSMYGPLPTGFSPYASRSSRAPGGSGENAGWPRRSGRSAAGRARVMVSVVSSRTARPDMARAVGGSACTASKPAIGSKTRAVALPASAPWSHASTKHRAVTGEPSEKTWSGLIVTVQVVASSLRTDAATSSTGAPVAS